ncbi:hypothetical protein ABPG72_014028 [Tetrahymena utriculariae]
MAEKEHLKEKFQIYSEQDQESNDKVFKKFNKSYSEYFTNENVSEKVIETDVRLIIEETLYRYREQIIQLEIRHKVVDIINLLINYLLIIKQNDSKQSIQSDIDQINSYLQKLTTYCKENKENYPCLELYQSIDILITLNSQRQGLDTANQSIPYKIAKKMVQVAKFGAGFVSIAGAIKNLTEINYQDIKNFFNEIKQITNQITSQSSTGAINVALDSYSQYNTNNLANNIQALWLKKIQVMGENLYQNDPILDIIFYLEESANITNNSTLLFVYVQLNYLLSRQMIKDNLQEISKKLEQEKKQYLIVNLANFLQVKEYSDGLVDKIKNIANLIAKNQQFRYIKAQLLLHFALILQNKENKQQFYSIMTGVASDYLQEKQKSVKIVYEGNQIMADFIHNHLDKNQILTQISQFKQQMTKYLDDKNQFDEFALEIQDEKEIEKELAKYYVQMWEYSVKQRQKKLQITHKDDVLLEAIYLYVKQQITYEGGFKIETAEKDAVKQIINQFLIPNFVVPSDDIQQNKQKNDNSSSFPQEGANAIEISLGKCTNLILLEFFLGQITLSNQNAIGLIRTSSMGQSLRNWPLIKDLKLSLSSNEIEDIGAISLAQGLSNSTQLTHLILLLKANLFGEKGAQSIGYALSNCTLITHLLLDLEENQIGHAGTVAIGIGLGNCKNLIDVQLWLGQISFNQFYLSHICLYLYDKNKIYLQNIGNQIFHIFWQKQYFLFVCQRKQWVQYRKFKSTQFLFILLIVLFQMTLLLVQFKISQIQDRVDLQLIIFQDFSIILLSLQSNIYFLTA